MKYYRAGKIYEGTPTKLQDNAIWRQADHDRQRREHAYELIQPYKQGKPNREFIEAYPTEAVTYFGEEGVKKYGRR